MSEIKDWYTSAASNTTASPNGYPIGTMLVSELDNVGRENQAAIRRFRDDISGVATGGGTANAQTLTLAATGISAYAQGDRYCFKAGATNTGACTIDVNSIGAANIFSGTTLAALTGGEIQSGGIYDIAYDGTQFLLLNPEIETANKTAMTAGVVDGAADFLHIYDADATEEKKILVDDLSTTVRGDITTTTITKFTASGTWTKPAGLVYAIFEVVGGGGGGGGVATVTGAHSAGGGAGGYAKALIAAGSLGATETVTIGAAGAAGSSAGGNGGAGGTTSLGAHISCAGGSGGEGATASTVTLSVGGNGGAPTISTGSEILKITGQAGADGGLLNGGQGLRADGGGGSNPLGFGGADTTNPPARAGTGYGAGGAGSRRPAAGNQAGGAGTAGYIVAYEYYA